MTVLLYSGGLDSTALAKLYKPDVLLYVDMRTRYSAAELRRLPEDAVSDLSLDFRMAEKSDAIVPFRNSHLLCVAAKYGDDILFGATAGDRSKDKDAGFVSIMQDLLNHMAKSDWSPFPSYTIRTPFADLTKPEIIKKYIDAFGNCDDLIKSFSCYTPVNDNACGGCKPCVRKYLAMKCNGVDVAHLYTQHPEESAYYVTLMAESKNGLRGREGKQYLAGHV